jgi:hypothetical protein
MAIAQTEATEQTPIAPTATASDIQNCISLAAPAPLATKTAPTATTATTAATGTDDEPPNRGDTGRGHVEPIAAKKLNLSLVAVKRITSDIPATNFDQFELEIAGELSLAIGGFVIPPVLVRDSSGYRIVSGHFQYHAAGKGPAVKPTGRRNNTDDRA